MTPELVAVNHAAIAAGAERLTATGWTGDAHTFVESLVRNALLDGYRPITPAPPLRGPGASRAAIDAAKAAAEAAVRAARDKRTTVTKEQR